MVSRVRCKWQKAATIEKVTNTSDSSTAYTYLSCTDANGSNFGADRLYGLNPFWVNLFNVHKCSNATSSTKVIPVLAFESASKTDYSFSTYKQYNFTPDDLISGTPSLSNITCLDITSKASIKTGLNLGSGYDDAKVDTMANCGLAILTFNEFASRAAFDNTAYSIDNATVNTTSTARDDK